MSKVYFLRDTNNRVKIGYSREADRRVAGLRTAIPDQTTLVRLIDGGRPTEKWLHRKFAHLRINGEWFRFDQAMLTIVPPDEIVARRQERPALRLTLRESLIFLDESGLYGPETRAQFAQMVVSCFWEDDLDDFLAWVRARTGVPAPSTSYPQVQSSLPIPDTRGCSNVENRE